MTRERIRYRYLARLEEDPTRNDINETLNQDEGNSEVFTAMKTEA